MDNVYPGTKNMAVSLTETYSRFEKHGRIFMYGM